MWGRDKNVYAPFGNYAINILSHRTAALSSSIIPPSPPCNLCYLTQQHRHISGGFFLLDSSLARIDFVHHWNYGYSAMSQNIWSQANPTSKLRKKREHRGEIEEEIVTKQTNGQKTPPWGPWEHTHNIPLWNSVPPIPSESLQLRLCR